MAVTNVAELNALVERVKKAQREYASFTQEHADDLLKKFNIIRRALWLLLMSLNLTHS
nr:hypothetical protein [Salmonella enterica]